MDLEKKLEILVRSAKYDVSCASSGSTRSNNADGIGNATKAGICHSWSADGRCISLLKLLLTNQCCYDCAYCVNRVSHDIPRALLLPEEIAELTIQFYLRNYIEGLFLSSAIYKNPDYTMERIYQTVLLLRQKHHFHGYIHVKVIPGADPVLIRKTGFLADRMSANIELPSQKSLNLLAPQKTKNAILSAMKNIHTTISEDGPRNPHKKSSFVPAGQSTQLIVGASPETDLTILRLSEALYKNFSLKRVYYSAYVPIITSDNRLPLINPPLKRENRLYQADWLLRFYGFTADELLNNHHPNFRPDMDPKSDWALSHMHLFPLEIHKAEYQMLIRVPGIGLRSAQRIMRLRRVTTLTFDELKKVGVVLKRARFFITCNGRHLEKNDLDISIMQHQLSNVKSIYKSRTKKIDAAQLHLFDNNLLPSPQAKISAITGEL